jgi:hypothetical protein
MVQHDTETIPDIVSDIIVDRNDVIYSYSLLLILKRSYVYRNAYVWTNVIFQTLTVHVRTYVRT